jgi:hypothetical protein
MHFSHGRAWRAAIGFDKNVVFLDVAARESYFHPPFEEFVHHQSRSCQASWKARPALSFGFALRNRAQDSKPQVGKKTGGDAAPKR